MPPDSCAITAFVPSFHALSIGGGHVGLVAVSRPGGRVSLRWPLCSSVSAL